MNFGFFTSGRIERQKVWLWKRHWERARFSAGYFGWKPNYSEEQVFSELIEKSALHSAEIQRFRIDFSEEGFQVRIKELEFSSALNAEIVVGESSDLYRKGIKAQDRSDYTFQSKLTGTDVFLIHDSNNHIAEFDIGNVILRDGRTFSTPPAELGFSGIALRVFSEFVRSKNIELNVVPTKADQISTFKELYLINAVRGVVPIQIPEMIAVSDTLLAEEVNGFFLSHNSTVSL